MKTSELKQVVETILFISDEPISTIEIQKSIDEVDVSKGHIEEALSLLNHDYQSQSRAFSIMEIGGGWQLRTIHAMKPWVQKLFRKQQAQKLSARALETLSIVAYNQPITKGRIEEIRGVNSDGIVRSLIEKELVTVVGREKSLGNPMLYSVTKKFLTHFGLNNVNELPSLKEIDELLKTDEALVKEINETMNPEQLGLNFNEQN